MICSECGSEMKKSHKEYYCPKCGLVVDLIDYVHICDFDQYSHGPAVNSWQANMRQTQKMYYWRNGKMILKIPRVKIARSNR